MESRYLWFEPDVIVPLLREAQETGSADALLAALYPVLARYYRHSVSHAIADDLTQDAAFRIAASYHRIRPPEHCAYYFARLARNVLVEGRRTAARHASRQGAPLEHVERECAVVPVADRLTELREQRLRIDRAVASLKSAALREVVFAYLRGLSLREIADELGLAPETVRMRWARARSLLRQDLALRVDAENRAGVRAVTPVDTSAAASDGPTKRARALGER